jgi:hypothetical protein
MILTQIIAEYMATHRRLVIPQLGAFLRKNETDELLFSEMLKRDDGVLIGLLRDRGLGDLEAQGVIDRFIFELRHTVESGSVFRAEHLGLFARGAQSNLCFRYLPLLEATPSASAPTPPVQESPVEEAPLAECAAPSEPVEQVAPTVVPEPEPVAEPTTSEPDPEPEAPHSESTEPEATKTEAAPNGGAEEARRKIKALLGDHPPQPHTSSRPRPADPSIKGLRYGKPGNSAEGYGYGGGHSASRKPDFFVILAIAAVVLALAALLYGYLNQRQNQDNPYYVGEHPIDVDPATLGDMNYSDFS